MWQKQLIQVLKVYNVPSCIMHIIEFW